MIAKGTFGIRNSERETQNPERPIDLPTKHTKRHERRNRKVARESTRMSANGDAQGNYRIFLPLITSLCQGSGWQARINADWM